MKPIKIEPRDITITTELSVSQVKKLKLYLELSEKLMNRVYESANEREIQEAIEYVHKELTSSIDYLLRHPLIQELSHGS